MATLKMMPRPIFFQILKALHVGFQMRYHLFQNFFGKMVKLKETSFLSPKKSSFSTSHCKFFLTFFSPRLLIRACTFNMEYPQKVLSSLLISLHVNTILKALIIPYYITLHCSKGCIVRCCTTFTFTRYCH